MKYNKLRKKNWSKPTVKELKFKDTFGGSSPTTFESGTGYILTS